MKLISAIVATSVIGSAIVLSPTSFARVPDSEITCRAWDTNDTYVNVRRSPNGELIKAVGNGTFFETNGKVDTIAARAIDDHGREWFLFNGHGCALASLLSCDINS